LGLDRVGIHDDFFELGGESLLALQILNRVRNFIQVDLSLQRFLETPSIAGLYGLIEQEERHATGIDTPPLVPLPRDRYRATQLPHGTET
jgi:phthiocerol/phenolphthiocerol synthesis type-I polyketide synthase E